jgi:hypothetical protein
MLPKEHLPSFFGLQSQRLRISFLHRKIKVAWNFDFEENHQRPWKQYLSNGKIKKKYKG